MLRFFANVFRGLMHMRANEVGPEKSWSDRPTLFFGIIYTILKRLKSSRLGHEIIIFKWE